LVKENLGKVKGLTFCGVAIEEMSRDELIACCVAGRQEEERLRKDRARNREMSRLFRSLEHGAVMRVDDPG